MRQLLDTQAVATLHAGMSHNTAAVILAAGQGKRMRASLPKVLHPCADLPMVAHVVRLAQAHGCSPVVVVLDPKGQPVRERLTALFPDAGLVFATQEQPRGTGDAVAAGLSAIPEHRGAVLVLYGDVPLLRAETLASLRAALGTNSLSMLVAEVADPTGYGRVVREAGRVRRVVEQKDASPGEQALREINVGVYLGDAELMRRAVRGLVSNNAQGELYLTDVVAVAAAERGVAAVPVADLDEFRGVNTQAELALVDSLMRRRLIAGLMEQGVRFTDPSSTYVGARVSAQADVVLGCGVQLLGQVSLGRGVRVEGPTVIKDCVVEDGAVIEAFCHLESAHVGKGAHVGPFARLRPEAHLEDDVRVGNFVEVKKTRMGKGAKANHLAYLGDAEVGAGANVGAGTITCNYDGVSKHRTVVGAGVFVGSNSTLVAPVSLGAGAYVAAGSTVTKDAPADALVFGRARQETREGYAKRLREQQAARKRK